MKQLPLREVMRNLGLTVTKDGYELSNPAGSARYDLHGVRTTVSGIPEYFPITLAVKGGYVPVVGDQDSIDALLGLNQPKTAESIGTMTLGINVDSAALSELENQLTRIAELYERIRNSQHQGERMEIRGDQINVYDAGGNLRVRMGPLDSNTPQPYRTAFTISAGQVFLCDAQVKDAVISKDILISELGKERQDYIKREVQAIIERELQAGGKLWQVTRGR